MVSKVNFCHWHHNLWCWRWIFAIDTTICGVRVEIFQESPIFQQELKFWEFGKPKVIWEPFPFRYLRSSFFHVIFIFWGCIYFLILFIFEVVFYNCQFLCTNKQAQNCYANISATKAQIFMKFYVVSCELKLQISWRLVHKYACTSCKREWHVLSWVHAFTSLSHRV